MWKLFAIKTGITAKATPYKIKEGSDQKVDYLALQVESLSKKIDKIIPAPKKRTILTEPMTEEIHNFIYSRVPNSVNIIGFDTDKHTGFVRIHYSGIWTSREMKMLEHELYVRFGYKTNFVNIESHLTEGT
jgi:hypothetical protein